MHAISTRDAAPGALATLEDSASVMAEPDLRPQSLQLTKTEVEFMARLGGLRDKASTPGH